MVENIIYLTLVLVNPREWGFILNTNLVLRYQVANKK